jgi:hypothetical protein
MALMPRSDAIEAMESPSSSYITTTARRLGGRQSSALHTVVRIRKALSGSAFSTGA